MMSGGEPKRTQVPLKYNVFSIKCLVLQNVLGLMLGDRILVFGCGTYAANKQK